MSGPQHISIPLAKVLADVEADAAFRDWPHEARLMVAGLRRQAARFRDLAADSPETSHAFAFRIAARAIERELGWASAKDTVRSALAASVTETAKA